MAEQPTGKRGSFEYEYVTSVVSLLKGDGIVVHVVNDTSAAAKAQVIIYRDTGAGAVTVDDTGPFPLTAMWASGLGHTLAANGEYWLRIRVSSEFLVPQASFERYQNSLWVPVVSYRPGDFAVFKLKPTRTRLW